MYINPSLLNMANNLNNNNSIQNNIIDQSIKDKNISDEAISFSNTQMNKINYQQKDTVNNNNFTSSANYNPQQIYANGIYPQPIISRTSTYNINNLNNINALGNLKPITNFNNINPIGNMNYIQNNRNKIQNIVPQIYDQNQKQNVMNPNNAFPINNFDLNNKMNLNINNNQIYQNRILNKNNLTNYSPLADQNLFPGNTNTQNLNYNGPKLIKNNTLPIKNNISLSSQSAKNTTPNFNVNAIDNLNLNNIYMQNTTNNLNNNQTLPLLIQDRNNMPHINLNMSNNNFNNIQNNFMMKNNHNFHNDINNHNNKFYKYGGKKKGFTNPELNESNKRNNSSKGDINNNFNKFKNTNDKDNQTSDEKNKGMKLLELNLKIGKNIVNFEIYSDHLLESFKQIKLKTGLTEDYIKLIFSKIKQYIDFSKEIFSTSLDFYTYKQLSNMFDESRKRIFNYKAYNRKSKSINNKNFINRFKNNDIKLYLCDIKKTTSLNNSF